MQKQTSLKINRTLRTAAVNSVVLISDGRILSFREDSSIAEFSLQDEEQSRPVKSEEISVTVTCADILLVKNDDGETQKNIVAGLVDGSVIFARWSPFAVISSVAAHTGAVCALVCNKHGTSLITGGVDGCVKLWSNKGALRSTLLRLESSIQDVSWANDTFHVAVCSRQDVFVIDLRQQRTSRHWTAHSGAVLSLEWSPVDMILATGGEDSRFCLFDSKGSRLFVSDILPGPILAVAWSSTGNHLCLGANSFVYICASTGDILNEAWL